MTSFQGYRLLIGVSLLLAAASVFLSALLFTRLDDQRKAETQSRVNITYNACAEQNERHDKTLVQLDKLIEKIPQPAQRERAKKNINGTKALIEALAPRHDCLRLIKDRFGKDARPT